MNLRIKKVWTWHQIRNEFVQRIQHEISQQGLPVLMWNSVLLFATGFDCGRGDLRAHWYHGVLTAASSQVNQLQESYHARRTRFAASCTCLLGCWFQILIRFQILSNSLQTMWATKHPLLCFLVKSAWFRKKSWASAGSRPKGTLVPGVPCIRLFWSENSGFWSQN